MSEKLSKLTVIDGETLMDARLEPIRYCVETLLPQGLCLLGGAPKIGKSWMVLDLCIRIAKGEAFLGCKTIPGTTLYLCLEDTYARIQSRLCNMTDEVPANSFFAVSANRVTDGLGDQIRDFCKDHPSTLLVVIDTFQLIRNPDKDTSYAADYQEMNALKQLADELKITLLLVHHLRKLGDRDPINKLSGTTGISGAVDAIYVLDKSSRCEDAAKFYCTGRDIEYREIELRFNKSNCTWGVEKDSFENPEFLLPPELISLCNFMKIKNNFFGTNTEFTNYFNDYAGTSCSPKALKQMMNKYRFSLESLGIYFESKRSNGQRLVKIQYLKNESGVGSDECDGTDIPCVPCVPCVTVTEDATPSVNTRDSRGKQSAWLSATAEKNGQKPEPTLKNINNQEKGVTQNA